MLNSVQTVAITVIILDTWLKVMGTPMTFGEKAFRVEHWAERPTVKSKLSL